MILNFRTVFEQSPFDNQPGMLSKQDDRVESLCSTQDSLIGTPKEREQLKNLIDEAYFPKIIDPIPKECPTSIMVDDEDDTECYCESPV